MRSKGVAPAVIIIIIAIMVLGSVFTALTIFGKQSIFEKRAFEEKILSVGNEIEIYGHLIDSASDLATIQAIHDVGQNVILDKNYEYNPDEYLPYWDSIPEDKIKEKIEDLSETYFKNYEKSYMKYLNELNQKLRKNVYYLEWKKEMKINEFDDSKIKIGFGNVTVNYTFEKIELIEKNFLIESSINTEFGRILEIGQDIINRTRNGEYLNETKISLETDRIKINLEDKGSYVSVSVYDNIPYTVYDIENNNQKQDYLGLKFLVDKGGSSRIKTDDMDNMDNIQHCDSWIVRTSNTNICSIFLP